MKYIIQDGDRKLTRALVFSQTHADENRNNEIIQTGQEGKKNVVNN